MSKALLQITVACAFVTVDLAPAPAEQIHARMSPLSGPDIDVTKRGPQNSADKPHAMRGARSAIPRERDLSQGEVVALQAALAVSKCYAGVIDGRWNMATQKALRAFERRAKLAPIALQRAYGAISSRPHILCEPAGARALPRRSPRQSSKRGANRGSVLALQAALAVNKCYAGIIDGQWDDETKQALRAFERRAGLAPLDPRRAFKAVSSRPRIMCDPVAPGKPRKQPPTARQRSPGKPVAKPPQRRPRLRKANRKRNRDAAQRRRKRRVRRTSESSRPRKRHARSRDCSAGNAPGTRSLDQYLAEMKCRRSRR